jgi:hypothetical protein
MLGHEAFGVDISDWAITNADEDVKQYVGLTAVFRGNLERKFDWIIAKDVLEHVPYASHTIRELMNCATRGMFAVVPLSMFDGNPYIIKEYEKDVTHIQRCKLLTWVEMFLQPGWRVEAAYRVLGVKDNWYKLGWERGNGFITARRIKE